MKFFRLVRRRGVSGCRSGISNKYIRYDNLIQQQLIKSPQHVRREPNKFNYNFHTFLRRFTERHLLRTEWVRLTDWEPFLGKSTSPHCPMNSQCGWFKWVGGVYLLMKFRTWGMRIFVEIQSLIARHGWIMREMKGIMVLHSQPPTPTPTLTSAVEEDQET